MVEKLKNEKYSNLMMELAVEIEPSEFHILLMGVYTRKLIKRREMEKVSNFSQLISFLTGPVLSPKNVKLLSDLLYRIERKDLKARIDEFARELEFLETQCLHPSQNIHLENDLPAIQQEIDSDNKYDYENELDDDEMIDSQNSCVSMRSLTDEEKRDRELACDF
ncbi:hypothetical protein LOTGIDRAFT_162675 [Lottia gigantea]|uniref:DED domain-containing protein n=1 Tax=Lottia gigantea TaxID=225164 RepID=V4A6P2_LOTGI|nr:hypothetical protein LOTGIDRAFT_162675 [Lottia gigantea]ESO92367.1 hypothetical protein LOTGIDRAFT_162675 [Lottia gigantea]